jgi:phenylacetate-CoA ligase
VQKVKSKPSALAQFLQAHPEFDFDVEEYVLSTKYAAALARRLAGFRRARAAPPGRWPAHAGIRAAIRRGACDWVPAYRGYKTMSIDEWPLIEKSRIRARPRDFLAADASRSDMFLKTTTGSSGAPISIWHDPVFYFEGLTLALPKIAVSLSAERALTRAVFCLAVSDDRAKKEFVTLDPLGVAGLSVRITVDEQKPESYDRVLDLLQELGPGCLSSKPSILQSLAARALKRGRPTAKLDFIVSSGAQLGAALRRTLERLFDTRAVEAYGLTEFGVVAFPCRHGSLHVDTASAYVEVLDDAGNPRAQGVQGEIVISSLANPAMPLLRYRTGDLGALEPRCACRASTPVLTRLSGRIIKCFRLPSGRLFAPTYFNDLFVRYPALREFQITQAGARDYEVAIDLLPAAIRSRRKVIGSLGAYIRSAIPERPRVSVKVRAFTQDGKFERFRSSL